MALDAHTNAQWAGPRVLPALNTTPAAPFVHCATLAGKELLPQISLNGQDETSSSLPFRFYDPPALLAISPTTGPALGGTHVYARGANLTRHGTLPVCRFGGALWRRGFGALSALTTSDALQGAHGVGARALHGLPPNEVPATIVNATHALCLTPPSVRGPMLELALEIALIGTVKCELNVNSRSPARNLCSGSGVPYSYSRKLQKLRLRGAFCRLCSLPSGSP